LNHNTGRQSEKKSGKVVENERKDKIMFGKKLYTDI
jgi:hypothetical protein